MADPRRQQQLRRVHRRAFVGQRQRLRGTQQIGHDAPAGIGQRHGGKGKGVGQKVAAVALAGSKLGSEGWGTRLPDGKYES